MNAVPFIARWLLAASAGQLLGFAMMEGGAFLIWWFVINPDDNL